MLKPYFHYVIIIIKNILQSFLKCKRKGVMKINKKKNKKMNFQVTKRFFSFSLDPSYFQTS